jgi:hypothetical protein
MYIYAFLLRMTDTMTSQNTDFSSWDIVDMQIAKRRVIQISGRERGN